MNAFHRTAILGGGGGFTRRGQYETLNPNPYSWSLPAASHTRMWERVYVAGSMDEMDFWKEMI